MYDVKPDRVGWTVYDAETGQAAVLDRVTLVELAYEAADVLACRLNRSVYGARPKLLSRWPLMSSVVRRDAGKPLGRH